MQPYPLMRSSHFQTLIFLAQFTREIQKLVCASYVKKVVQDTAYHRRLGNRIIFSSIVRYVTSMYGTYVQEVGLFGYVVMRYCGRVLRQE